MYDSDRLKQQKAFKEDMYWSSPFNFMADNNMGLEGRNVQIHDVTLRDGEQTSNVAFSMGDRLRVAEALNDLGVARIEAGMPIISEEVRASLKKMVDMAEECGVRKIIVEHLMNPYLIQHAYGIDRQKVIENCVDVIGYAQEKGLKTIFMGWDLTRVDDMEYLEDVYKQIFRQTSPDSVVLVDTLGCALPRAAGYLVKQFTEWLPGTVIEYHNHNEFGIANAGVLEAVAAGADIVHSSINGLGERTGNAATEEIVVMLEVLAGVNTGVNLEKIMEVSVLLENITNVTIPRNKPIVGRGLFDSESGIAVDIMRKLEATGFKVPEVTGAFSASMVGQDEGKPVLGKNSGKATIAYFLEKLDMQASKDQIGEITEIVKAEGRIQRRLLSEGQFRGICEKVL